MNKEERLEYEKYFRAVDINQTEQAFYMMLLNNCKDIIDSKNKVGTSCKGQIVEMMLRKEPDGISFNGSVVYEVPTEVGSEVRCISGLIFNYKDQICVDTKVERIGHFKDRKTYTVLDKFTVENDKIINRESMYNYEMLESIGGKTK